MNDSEFASVSQLVLKETGDAPYVLVMHDEQTKELRLSSNLTVESLKNMLGTALDRVSTPDFQAVHMNSPPQY